MHHIFSELYVNRGGASWPIRHDLPMSRSMIRETRNHNQQYLPGNTP